MKRWRWHKQPPEPKPTDRELAEAKRALIVLEQLVETIESAHQPDTPTDRGKRSNG